MKTQITIIAIIFLSLTTSSLHAQIDQDKMDQDVRVASKVLESLTHGDNRLMMYSDNVEGNYLADYGVIFSIGGGYSYTGGEEAQSAPGSQ